MSDPRFGLLPCPRCGEKAPVMIDLEHLNDCWCRACEGDFTVCELREMFGAWRPVLDWIGNQGARAECG